MIFLIATVDIKPGCLKDLVAAAQPCIAATRQEPGCIRYDLNVDVNNSERVVFVEQWKSRDDLTLHFESEHMATWRAASADMMVGRKIEVIYPEKVETL